MPEHTFTIEVGANPTANGGWEYFLLVGGARCGQSCFRSDWIDPEWVLPDLLRRLR